MKKIEMSQAVPRRYRPLGLLIGVAVVAVVAGATSRSAQAVVLPPLPNTIQQWNKIAEDTVVGSGAFQGQGEIYMSYTSVAVYDAVVAIQGGYEPYGPAISAPAGASVDCGRRRGRVPDAAARTSHRRAMRPMQRAWRSAASLLTDYTLATGRDARPAARRRTAVSDWPAAATASSPFARAMGA